MSKKHNLPDSLELLLDTMCNTFGGIMFIAISLIIISQLITKTQSAMTPEEVNRANMKQMEQNIDVLQNEILVLKKKDLEFQFQGRDASPEKEKVIRELAKRKEKNLHLQMEVERAEIKNESAAQLLKRLQEESFAVKNDLALRKSNLTEKKKRALEKQKMLQEQIAQLEETLKKIQPKELRFSMETATDLSPYWVFLRDNRVYRRGMERFPLTDEVSTEDFNYGRNVRMILKKGTLLNDLSFSVLNSLFRDVDRKRCFVSLVVDHNSFAALFAIKQYLRDKGIRVFWRVDPKYEFVYSDNVTHRASE